MDFHGINTVGKIWLERINSKPVYGALGVNNPNNGRVIFSNDIQTLSIGTSAGWVDIASATAGGITNPSVPIGGSILFYSNTALNGYILHADPLIDDDVVYITKGSVAGGETGGAAKVGGTWTQVHSHPTRDHTLSVNEMPVHNHPPKSGVANFMSSTGSSHGKGGDSYGIHGVTGYRGGGLAHNHGLTYTSSDDGWRPKGRNFTLQTKQ